MIRKYFDKRKYDLFPEIKDFTVNHWELRSKNVNDMSYNEWFWFHPSAFKLIYYGIHVIGICVFGGFGLLALLRGLILPSTILFILAIILGFQFAGKIRNRKSINRVNFYDTWLRE